MSPLILLGVSLVVLFGGIYVVSHSKPKVDQKVASSLGAFAAPAEEACGS